MSRVTRASTVIVGLALLVAAAFAYGNDGDAGAAAAEATKHDFGAWSLVPALVAIVLAVTLRRVVPALLAGVFAGALIAAGGNPIVATYHTIETHLWGALVDQGHLRIIAFTLMMGAMVGVMTRCGGMRGLVDRLLPFARSRRSGQVVAWVLGLVVFFDDYANTVVLGQTLRPMTDRLRISRAKLAYIVDATAAPVAGLAIVSTWVAAEVGYINDALAAVQLPSDQGLAVFVASMPSRFYVLWTLVMVAAVGVLGRDFGPMLKAEREAAADVEHTAEHTSVVDDVTARAANDPPPRAINAIAPVATIVIVFFVVLLLPALFADERPTRLLDWIGAGDSYLALFYGALAGAVVAVLLPMAQRIITWAAARDALATGARGMLSVLCVLVLAWALAGVVGDQHLDAGNYIASLLSTEGGAVSRLLHGAPQLLPTLVFLVAAGMSFATGTSWGTMAILMPIALKVATALVTKGETLTTENPLLVTTVASVLAGAIFGDHCSPISDTTVLSSQSTGCNHLRHVETQMPYALVIAAMSVVGLLLDAAGVSPWIVSIVGAVAVVALVRVVGKRVTT